MAIQKYQNPFEDLMPQNLSTLLDRLFHESVPNRHLKASFNPKVDTCETDTGYEIEVSLPGLKKDEINVDFHDGRLTISGERKFTDEKKTRKYHTLESQYGSFSRSFYLPDTINAEGIDARFEDGVLKIMVPKETRQTRKQQIQIKETGTTVSTKKAVGQSTGTEKKNQQHSGNGQKKTAKKPK